MHESLEKNHSTWQLREIDFSAIRKELVHDDEDLFYLLASASFVEILSELYAKNLIDHYRDNGAVVSWLEQRWQREEVQHGNAFKAYVQAVWPEFDWDGAYAGFVTEYAAICTVAELEPSQALEMVARCVVEVGTASFYQSIYHYTHEPILRQLLANIKTDEVRHFTEFRRYFKEYNQCEGNGAWRVGRVMWHRMLDIRAEDSYIAFKHVYSWRNPNAVFHDGIWEQFLKRLHTLARLNYPYRMAVEMILSPLSLPNMLKHLLRPPLISLARFALFR